MALRRRPVLPSVGRGQARVQASPVAAVPRTARQRLRKAPPSGFATASEKPVPISEGFSTILAGQRLICCGPAILSFTQKEITDETRGEAPAGSC